LPAIPYGSAPSGRNGSIAGLVIGNCRKPKDLEIIVLHEALRLVRLASGLAVSKRRVSMAKSPTDKTSKSRTSQKAAGNPVPSKSGSKSGTTPKERAQPRAATRSRAETRSQPVSTQSQPAAKSQSTSDTPAKTPARSGATVPQNWLASIETMISSQDGREILADALRAAANVLSRPRQDRQQGAETRDQQDAGTGRQQGFSAASRQAERAGAAGLDPGADAAMDAQLPLTAAGEQADPMTGTQPGSADSEGGTADRGAGKRRSSRKKRAASSE
jgi:hypothetical protein